MTEILIHRCRLRLVRHGGWSWGPDPQALLQAAVRALPVLLAAALKDLFPGEEEREITAPVRLRLRVGRGELLAALAGLPMDGAKYLPGTAPALAGRLAAALAEALAVELLPGMNDPAAPETPESPAVPLEMPLPPPAFSPVGRLLRAWWDRGDLALRLALLATPALETLRSILLREAEERGNFPLLSAQTIERLEREAEGPAAQWRTGSGDRAAALRVWLMAAVEIAARCGLAAGHPAVVRVLARSLPEREEQSGEVVVLRGHSPGFSPEPGESPVPEKGWRPPAGPEWETRVGARLAQWRDAEVHVASALPFLLLGPLSRTGYLETLATAFAAIGLSEQLPLFAAALAYKVLPPPERGWRRSPAAARAAAAFAGLAEPVPQEALADLTRRAAPCLDLLTADLAASLLAGHEPGRPLLLTQAGGGLLLAETDGVFPIAWAAGIDGLLPYLVRLRDETLWVPAEAAAPGLLRSLDAAGCRFLSPAPPTRGETWSPLRLPAGGRVWTNDPARPGLARQAADRDRLDAAEEGGRRLWQALAVDRLAAPLAADPAVDRHLTLAAGMALGTLAWTLWRDREPVDPVLALERFGDLDARVRFRARSVHVLLPMGRRHLDLSQHGLLEPVRDAAWLGGRVLEYGGG